MSARHLPYSCEEDGGSLLAGTLKVMGACLQVIKAIPGAVMLGFGTIFQPKAKADDHWSVSPKIVLVEESQEEGSGAPPWKLAGSLPRIA